MPRIAISYRRADSIGTTGRIFDKLVAHFGEDNVFRDIDNVPLSVDFRTHIRSEIARSDIVLSIIGPRWLDEENRKRFSNPKDLVRIEMEIALELGIPLIPVLVDYATMPSAEPLPDTLKSVVYRNAAEVDPGRDFHRDMDRLVHALDKLLADRPARREAEGERGVALGAAAAGTPAVRGWPSMPAEAEKPQAPPAADVSAPAPKASTEEAHRGLAAVRDALEKALASGPEPVDSAVPALTVTEAPHVEAHIGLDAIRVALESGQNDETAPEEPESIPSVEPLPTPLLPAVPIVPSWRVGFLTWAAALILILVAAAYFARPYPAPVRTNVSIGSSQDTAPQSNAPPAPVARIAQPIPPAPADEAAPREAAQVAPDKVARTEPPPRPKVSGAVATMDPSGAYAVQISSQRTEAEVLSSYRALQQRFSTVLGELDVLVRRVDLGEKGVWYRGQLGPFRTAADAGAFCDSLKAAGGQCVVQRN